VTGLFGDDFACQLMDPPWLERGAGKIKRGADRHYPLMPVDQIHRVIMNSGCWRPAPDSHLWMWVTDNFLEDGLWLIKQLGHRYIRTFPWVKVRDDAAELDGLTREDDEQLQLGLGQYARGAHELLLFAVKGHLPVPPPERRPKSVILAKRGRHSAKPEKSYRVIEAISPGPRVEFFCRTPRPGWTAWGNEIPQSEET
jgi:N6-adenosine-specific RNA methylase IME4